MEKSNGSNSSDRLDRIEAIIESNNKFLEGFSLSVRELRTEVKELRDGLVDLKNSVSELTDDVKYTQRQIREVTILAAGNSARIADHTADIRELQIENKRILNYLEQQAKFFQSSSEK